ncbi:MAG: hypothetical protein U0P45_15245 [Acidimicrobiales bacterium]
MALAWPTAAGAGPVTPTFTTADGYVPTGAAVIASRTTPGAQVVLGDTSFAVEAPTAQRVLGGTWRSGTTKGLDAFLYTPGPGKDGILHVRPSGDTYTSTFEPLPVNGTLQPIATDVDGNGRTDILWYAPGPAPDYLWLFKQAGGFRQVPLRIDARATPIPFETGPTGPGANTMARHLLWYGSGSAPDSLWTWDDQGGHITRPLTIRGEGLRPIVGSFTTRYGTDSHDQILWYSPHGRDSLWTWDRAGQSHRTSELPDMAAGYRPIVVGAFGNSIDPTAWQGIFWYRPGTLSDRYWAFDGMHPAPKVTSLIVDGTYTPIGTVYRYEAAGQLRHVDAALMLGPTSLKRWDVGSTIGQAASIAPIPPDPVGATTSVQLL